MAGIFFIYACFNQCLNNFNNLATSIDSSVTFNETNGYLRPKKKAMCVYYLMKISNRVGRSIFFFLFFSFLFNLN